MSKISKPFSGLSLVIGLSLGHGIKHFGQGALTVIGPLLKASMGLSEVSYALIFSSMNVSSGLSNIPAGILSDMYRKKNSLVSCYFYVYHFYWISTDWNN